MPVGDVMLVLLSSREIATMTYRSGPEWGERFGRNRISDENPSLCPTFVIESYLDYQGESFSTKFDPNSLLYISKASLNSCTSLLSMSRASLNVLCISPLHV